MEIPIVVQYRHIHLSQKDALLLFGTEFSNPLQPLDQRNQFVYSRTVDVHGPNGSFLEVPVLGPWREQTQIELSSSDAHAIGVNAPLRISGDLHRSGSVQLQTSHARIKAVMSVIVPIRHVHLPPDVALAQGLVHHDVISVTLAQQPHVVFDHVVVRVHPTFNPAFHLTVDEATPHWIQTGDHVRL